MSFVCTNVQSSVHIHTHTFLSINQLEKTNQHILQVVRKTPSTVKRVLLDCPILQDIWQKYFTASAYFERHFESIDSNQNIIDFFKLKMLIFIINCCYYILSQLIASNITSHFYLTFSSVLSSPRLFPLLKVFACYSFYVVAT